MRPRRLLSLLLLPALWSCSTSDTNPIVDFGEGEGITYRDGNNFPMGPRDYTDWTTDATWNKPERDLFADANVDLNGAQRTALISFATAYPNPAPAGVATWTLQTQRGAGSGVNPFTVRAVVVNRQYQVLQRFGPLGFGFAASFRLDYAAIGLSPRELYRLYYVVTDASGLVYKGHGDVRHEPQQ
ncbi:hypothetical protein ACFST9_21050 [Hymenobacter monticola]|uniref:Lipoprotein n=1 Tax=Hymenobacter monticola TaxID=1705399 RepID=A0ABY4B5H6_9BACT|nr:hypothetical protein [Hymenobacter monticola]UOE34414.1 hypothetical protein MTP16_01860 [Hymenobacter monticola]